jgi:glycosyltransferase involved in cell wall biosynthesis
MRIDMFVYNRCTTDARVLKEARTLADAGHRVRIVAVLDETTAAKEEREGFRIVRIDRNPIHYRLLRATRIGSRLWRRPVAALGSALSRSRPGRVRGLARLALAPLVLLERGVRRLLLVPHKPLMFFDYYWRTYRLVRADPPEALHAHDLNTLPVGAALARRLRLPLTYDAHELYPEISTLSPREAATWRFLERRLARRADNTLTVCDSIAAELEQRYGVARPTVLLNCPAAGEQAQNKTAERGSLITHSLNKKPRVGREGEPALEREPVVLYQGGFAPHRGLETLVRSAHRLERGTILLMGWGRLEEELRRLIAREGLEGRVRIVGPVPPGEVVVAAAAAAVGVIPYEPVGLNNTYTTPNKLFDYMAAGLPVAASRLPELIRFVEGGEIGLTFPPGDPTALGAALNEILADPDRYQLMRERSQEAGRRYTWERESTKLLALYDGC